MPRRKVPLAVALRIAVQRAALGGLGRIHPARAGRSATELFLSSRPKKTRVTNAAPLGARRLGIAAGGVGDAFVWGDGERTALLVHGWGADSSSMYGLAKPLRELGFRVVTYDAPAHGVSAGSSTTMRAFVSAIQSVVAQVAPEVVIGHSLGAVASVAALAEEARSSVRTLVLVSAPCSVNDALLAFASFWRLPPKVLEHVRRELFDRNGVPVEYWDIAALSERVRARVLLVHDQNDLLVPVGAATELARIFPRAEREITIGLGHMRILSHPAVAAKIRHFIEAEGSG